MTYNTEKRTQILSLLRAENGKALSVDEIAARIYDNGGKSTVYRIISRLVADGTVQKITAPGNGRTVYQYIGGKECHEHLHLKCAECGRLIHLDGETSHELRDKLMSASHFELDECALLFGRCEGCSGGGRI